MKNKLFFLAALAVTSKVSAITFDYSTFTDQTVKTTSTVYPSVSASAPPHAQSTYVYNPAVNAYPDFSSINGSLASNAPGTGLPNATALSAEALTLILEFKAASAGHCSTCQTVFAGLAARMKVQQETLSDIANPFCTALEAVIPIPICIGLLKIGSSDIGGVLPAMDMLGDDGQILCAFMFGSCDLPAPPKLDLNVLFKGKTEKPPPRQVREVSPCEQKEPLKVLHISDYHLDNRYVVGSEANCTGDVCCRVFPYTNVSAPIEEPASLFGNYLCDTPEPLATSVFRSVPEVTGYKWEEFSFGIFTGDLVSHDLWELTAEYVLAEELESYQQFFNGMGGVKLYPTLGWVSSYYSKTQQFLIQQQEPRYIPPRLHRFPPPNWHPASQRILPSPATSQLRSRQRRLGQLRLAHALRSPVRHYQRAGYLPRPHP
jgi:hypothetical protein